MCATDWRSDTASGGSVSQQCGSSMSARFDLLCLAIQYLASVCCGVLGETCQQCGPLANHRLAHKDWSRGPHITCHLGQQTLLGTEGLDSQAGGICGTKMGLSPPRALDNLGGEGWSAEYHPLTLLTAGLAAFIRIHRLSTLKTNILRWWKKGTSTKRSFEFESEFALAGLQSLILSNKAWQVNTKHPTKMGRKRMGMVQRRWRKKMPMTKRRLRRGCRRRRGGGGKRWRSRWRSALFRLQNPADEMWSIPQGKSQAILFPIRNILYTRVHPLFGWKGSMRKQAEASLGFSNRTREKCKLRQSIFECICTNGIEVWEISDMWGWHGQYATRLMCFRVCC